MLSLYRKSWLFSQFQVFYSCLVHSKVHFLNGLVTPALLVFYWPSLNYCLFMLSWWPYQKWESANSRVEKDEFRCIKIWAVPRVKFEYSYTVPSFYCCCLLLAFIFCSYIGLKCCLCLGSPLLHLKIKPTFNPWCKWNSFQNVKKVYDLKHSIRQL